MGANTASPIHATVPRSGDPRGAAAGRGGYTALFADSPMLPLDATSSAADAGDMPAWDDDDWVDCPPPPPALEPLLDAVRERWSYPPNLF
jgi:hypothetical protein